MADDPRKPRASHTPPGAVQHDARGNAVWEWAKHTGKQALDSTSALLKKLDVPGLKLEDDDKPVFRSNEPAKSEPRQTGYNPYGDRGAPTQPPTKSPARPPAKALPPAKPSMKVSPRASVAAPAPKSSFLARLFGRK